LAVSGEEEKGAVEIFIHVFVMLYTNLKFNIIIIIIIIIIIKRKCIMEQMNTELNGRF